MSMMLTCVMLCMPRMADWGGLMMGVDSIDPYTPPLLMVNVPPAISSMLMVPSRALRARSFMACSKAFKGHTGMSSNAGRSLQEQYMPDRLAWRRRAGKTVVRSWGSSVCWA